MAKVSLTSLFVRSAACLAGARKSNFFDINNPGFLLEVRISGGKTFYQRYRDGSGRERQVKIGSPRVLSLSQARRKARQVLAEVALGADPQRKRRELRGSPTLAEFINEQYLPFAKSAKRSWRTDESVLRVQILPVLGRYRLTEISTSAIVELLGRLRSKTYAPGTINRVLILLRFALNLAKKWNIPGSQNNPTAGLKTLPEKYHERFLSVEEMLRLFAALDVDENQTAARAIKLLLLTGARRNEITHARWEYVNWPGRTLLVPISKNGRPRLINLNSAAVKVLASMERNEDDPYIFASPKTGKPSPSLHFPWTRIRERAGLQGVRLHDLRHSFASYLVNKGVSIFVVQGLLGHSLVRTTQRYAHLANATLSDAAEIVAKIAPPLRSETPNSILGDDGPVLKSEWVQ